MHSISKFSTLNDMKNFQPNFNFFIGIDSDGTIFDSMEQKHKYCYVEPLIEIFDLDEISKSVIMIWNYINISSPTRGINRFKALILLFDYLIDFDKKSKISYPNLDLVKKWIKVTKNLSDKSLKEYLILSSNYQKKEFAKKALRWSYRVNILVNQQDKKVKLFTGAIEALKSISNKADIMVLSNTPLATLHNDWKKNNLYSYISMIGGQETGTKREMLNAATFKKYDRKRILIIGDSNSDYLSAKKNNCNFFPIIPKNEVLSWRLFLTEGSINFFNEKYSKLYENKLLKKFNESLNMLPSWKD